MGDVLAFKSCRWSANGLCLGASIEACVCHRPDRFKPKQIPAPPSCVIEILDVAAKECPPPYEPPSSSNELIAFAKTGEPKIIETAKWPGGIDDLCPDEEWPPGW